MLTSSVDGVQAPLEIVHRSTVVAPATNPVTVEVGEAGVVTEPAPEITVHSPVPTVGVFAAKVVAVVSHNVWSGPAAATVGTSSTVIITSSVEAGQDPFVTVHLKVAEAPTVKPVTPEVGDAGVVTEAEPAITVHIPDPTAGVLPAKVAVVTLHKS